MGVGFNVFSSVSLHLAIHSRQKWTWLKSFFFFSFIILASVIKHWLWEFNKGFLKWAHLSVVPFYCKLQNFQHCLHLLIVKRLFTASVSDQKPGSYSLETLTCSRESSIFRIKGALVSDVKMGCNQGGFNYRGLGGRQSWTRPSMNRNNHVSTPETDAAKVRNLALVHFRVKRLQSSERNWCRMWHFHPKPFRAESEWNKEGGGTRETEPHLAVAVLFFCFFLKKWVGTCLESLFHSYFPSFPLVSVVLRCSADKSGRLCK